jgi:hypothetical protein
MLDSQGIEVNFTAGAKDIYFSTTSRPALRPTQFSSQWVLEPVLLGTKQLWCEADNSSSFSPEVKNICSTVPVPPYVFMVWCLIKHRDSFYLCKDQLVDVI